ncbi:MAG: ribonuclease H-like domain-containing protein [Deltaproteobacteria bacterium]|nr:ribonuclease H-like domain-containing protein [Deltaproteobacteria bacterium]
MADRRVVLDLETKKTFDEVGGRDRMDQLGITVVGVYNYATEEYLTFEEKEMGPLQNLLIDASLIIGFNHIGFDFPVLQPYLSVDVTKLPVFDIMADFQKRMGHRIGLDSIAKATLGIGKTGHGLDAIRFYREGKMKELKEYCLNDVKVTKEVFDYGVESKKIFYYSKMGNQKKELPVEWGEYRKPRQQEEVQPAQYKLF